MKLHRVILTVLLLAGFNVVLPQIWAAEEHSKADIQLLKDSAAALQKVDSALAGKLSQYAVKEANEKEEAEEHEKGEISEAGDIQLLKNAAAALQASRPDLAGGLKRYADQEAKEGEEGKHK